MAQNTVCADAAVEAQPRTDFHVQIDERLKARVEALASRISVDMNELVEHLVKRWVERTDPEEPDVTLHEVLIARQEDNGVKAALRGDVVPHEEAVATFDERLVQSPSSRERPRWS
ncbi:hypothetical protein CDN99_02870 [Roseateles aquatilis]|uniref:Uncharacterized protein n=1 Tax=Roseateles aquatilis TaxID=431061 RepID=A0A246JLD3_9BURK|nr:hypothetical protein [Roseateles aquatilis]OWQ93431.1 hypothetical protein CDN99_02870 [Roseateles aquatilis]